MDGFSFDAYDEFEYEEYEEIFVIEITDIKKFILWMKKQTLVLSLYQIGKTFFDDPKFYKDKWDVPDEEDLSDNDVFEEVFSFLVADEDKNGNYYITTDDAEEVLGVLTNKYIRNILSKLVDMGVLEMCWDGEQDKIIFRVSKNSEWKISKDGYNDSKENLWNYSQLLY